MPDTDIDVNIGIKVNEENQRHRLDEYCMVKR